MRLFLPVVVFSCFLNAFISCADARQPHLPPGRQHKEILPGAYALKEYLPMLKGKKVALLINQTSRIGSVSLLDTLLQLHVDVRTVFVPEHGFRGTADAGAHISNTKDEKTGVPIISLYGSNKKPGPAQLSEIDIVVYDLQDVGTRFYTYISTLQYMMEACAASHIPLLVLDRPNPNGHYVDGPVLEDKYRSFVGMQRIPVVYGMTVAEYAKMLMGEGWVTEARGLDLKLIKCSNYDHNRHYSLPVAPSPNLKNMAAVYLYPSLCFFEGTVVSVGRGTEKPFQQWGHPKFATHTDYFFIPQATTGASKPLYERERCFGRLIASEPGTALEWCNDLLQLKPLLEAYAWYADKEHFFNDFFEKLAGNDLLRDMIVSGRSEEDIRKSWAADIEAFKKVRKKYLLYKDFE